MLEHNLKNIYLNEKELLREIHPIKHYAKEKSVTASLLNIPKVKL